MAWAVRMVGAGLMRLEVFIRKSTLGFTLIEVLVALAIVAVTLGAGLRTAGALVGSTERQRDVFLGGLCVHNQLALLRLSPAFPAIATTPFECEQAGRRLQGEQVVTLTPNPSFVRVDVAVKDGDVTVLRTTTVLGRY